MRHYTQAEADKLAARLNAKADRRQDWADSRASKADAANQTSRNAVAGIAFGQPVIAGHHSAKRHRAALARSRNAADRMLEHSNMADKHQGKADRARAFAVEVQRRAQGPRYTKADLVKGDRVSDNRTGKLAGIVVRANAKTVTVETVHTTDHDATQLRYLFYEGHTLRWDYLAITTAWRSNEAGEWTEIAGTGPAATNTAHDDDGTDADATDEVVDAGSDTGACVGQPAAPAGDARDAGDDGGVGEWYDVELFDPDNYEPLQPQTPTGKQ